MTDFSELVYRGVESDVLDYKAPVNWILLTKQQKAKFVRHALAFANTRGGAIVIGVREDANGHPSLYEGLNDEQCHSFDPSTVVSYINSHVDPAIDITVERPEVDGKRYAILIIKPFSDIPHVATHSIDEELRNGVFYIRSASASSRPAARAGEMHELIRRALRNQRDLLGNLLRDILGEHQETVANTAQNVDILPPEYDESVQYFSKRLNPRYPAHTPVLDIAVMPTPFSGNIPLPMLQKLAIETFKQLPEQTGKLFMDSADMEASYVTNVSLRGMNKERNRFWQIFQNGLIHLRFVMPQKLKYQAFHTQLTTFLSLVGFFYTAGNLGEKTLNFRLTLENSTGMTLNIPGAQANTPNAVCRIEPLIIEDKISCAELKDQSEIFAKKLMDELSVRFNAHQIKQ